MYTSKQLAYYKIDTHRQTLRQALEIVKEYRPDIHEEALKIKDTFKDKVSNFYKFVYDFDQE